LVRTAGSMENVTVLAGFRVRDLIYEGDVVAGVKGEDSSGVMREFRASLVVGADGRHSIVRKLVKSEQKIISPSTVAIYFGYFSNFQHDGEAKFEVYKRGKNMAILFPTNDNHYVVTANFPLSNTGLLDKFKNNSEKSLRQLLTEQFPNTTIAARLTAATLSEPVRGLHEYENYWYKGMGKGWALVGDAICFKDPAMAQGIHDAIRGAQLLADILKRNNEQLLRQWDQIAEEYQQAIEDEFMVRFHMGCELSKNEPISEQQDAVNKLISAYPTVIEKFLGMYNYANEPSDFEAELHKVMNMVS